MAKELMATVKPQLNNRDNELYFYYTLYFLKGETRDLIETTTHYTLVGRYNEKMEELKNELITTAQYKINKKEVGVFSTDRDITGDIFSILNVLCP